MLEYESVPLSAVRADSGSLSDILRPLSTATEEAGKLSCSGSFSRESSFGPKRAFVYTGSVMANATGKTFKSSRLLAAMFTLCSSLCNG